MMCCSLGSLLIMLHYYTARKAAQCIVIAPVCVFVCGSALLQPVHSVCVTSERFFILCLYSASSVVLVRLSVHTSTMTEWKDSSSK